MEKECPSINIDNKNYLVIDKIKIGDIEYWYLSNESDSNDFLIQKLSMLNNEEVIVNLDSNEEFDMAIMEFSKKNLSA